MTFAKTGTGTAFHAYRPVGWVRVSGADAGTFLQGQFTQELRGLRAGLAAYGLWLNEKGKVLADSFIIRSERENEFWLMSYFCPSSVLVERLEPYVIADDVFLEDESSRWAAISLIGEGDLDEWMKAGACDGFVFPGRRQRGKNLEWIFPVERLASVREQFLAAGAVEKTEADVERLRIESGIPAVTRDIGPGDLPNEGGLEDDAISYTKGCYLGQEVMARLKSMGRVRRRLLRVTSDQNGPASLPAPLFLRDRVVGELRSAANDESAGKFIGLALLSLMHLQPQAALAFAAGGVPAVRLVDAP